MAAPSEGKEESGRFLTQQTAVLMIEKWWMTIRDKRIFKVLKSVICSAEHSLTHEILRKLSPRECILLKDPSMQTKVKFRLNGTRFPPAVVFKIYSKSQSVQYINGRDMFHSKTEAAEDARQQMGNRTYYDQLIFDSTRHNQYTITDLHDIGTIKDYMKYSANLDETPALYGGRENYWRELDLNDLPRHCITSGLFPLNIYQRYLPHSAPNLLPRTVLYTPLHRKATTGSSTDSMIETSRGESSSVLKHITREKDSSTRERGTKLALKRVQKMRRSFTNTTTANSTYKDDSNDDISLSPLPDGMGMSPDGMGTSPDGMGMSVGGDEEGYESEILQLYKWTQDLSLEDLN